MGYTLESDNYETRVELANGAKIYFNLRGVRRSAELEVPLVCVFYESPPPEREMDYLEMSLFTLDDKAMIGNVSIDGADVPEMRFLNLSDETNEAIGTALRGAFQRFLEDNRRRLIELAGSSRRCDQHGPAANATCEAKVVIPRKARRRKAGKKAADSSMPEFTLPEGFLAARKG